MSQPGSGCRRIAHALLATPLTSRASLPTGNDAKCRQYPEHDRRNSPQKQPHESAQNEDYRENCEYEVHLLLWPSPAEGSREPYGQLGLAGLSPWKLRIDFDLLRVVTPILASFVSVEQQGV
jgi:hypothetical protein